MTILVTGANGMIGSKLVDELLNRGHRVIGIDKKSSLSQKNEYIHYAIDLADEIHLKNIINEENVEKIIHLAALAHTNGENDLSYERYYHVNVECARNVFTAAMGTDVLFISTIDVYGFTKGVVTVKDSLAPVSFYAQTKMLAEEECKKKCKKYTIFRFCPVYTKEIKRDIQKRYYLKYPSIAYQIGTGTEYEVLDVNNAVKEMVDWCNAEPKNEIRIIKDSVRMNTKDCIVAEKEEGRAKLVLYFPKWLVNFGYLIVRGLTGENKYTYLLSKAVHPMRSE